MRSLDAWTKTGIVQDVQNKRLPEEDDSAHAEGGGPEGNWATSEHRAPWPILRALRLRHSRRTLYVCCGGSGALQSGGIPPPQVRNPG